MFTHFNKNSLIQIKVKILIQKLRILLRNVLIKFEIYFLDFLFYFSLQISQKYQKINIEKILYSVPQDQPYQQPKQYQHIKSKIDSGYNTVKYYKDHQYSIYARNLGRVTQGFKRIRLSTLQKWVETAMIVLSVNQQNLKQNLKVQKLNKKQLDTLTETLSMTCSEATICCNEQGVPPMYICSQDILDKKEKQNIDIIMSQKVNNYELQYEDNTRYDKFIKQQTLNSSQLKAILSNQNQTKQISSQYKQKDIEAYEALTTRNVHQQLIDFILENPENNEYEIQLYNDQQSDKILIPNLTKTYNFVIIDMREDKSQFDKEHIWGSVYLPLSYLHRANTQLPGSLQFFSKFDQSLFVVVGLLGRQLEEALKQLQDYGLQKKQLIPLLSSLEEVKQKCSNLIISSE